MRRRSFIGGLVAAPAVASAQSDWPNKQIRIVIPYPPGGPSDITTRLVLERAGALLGQSVLFDNKAGASGAIGAEHVKNSPADGYTFLTTTTAMVCITQHLQPLPYDPGKDFVAVARTCHLVDRHGHQPAGAGQQPPGVHRLRQGQPRQDQLRLGRARHHHPALRRDVQHRGRREDGARALQGQRAGDQDLLSGQIQVQFDPTTLPHIAAGRLKCFAILGEKRWPGKPDIPTLKEQGLGKIGGDAWYGILAAKGTPQMAIDKLAKAIGEAVKDPALNEKLVTSGNYASFQDAAAFGATIERERASFGEIIKKADIKV